jgi:hypothetical protein
VHVRFQATPCSVPDSAIGTRLAGAVGECTSKGQRKQFALPPEFR